MRAGFDGVQPVLRGLRQRTQRKPTTADARPRGLSIPGRCLQRHGPSSRKRPRQDRADCGRTDDVGPPNAGRCEAGPVSLRSGRRPHPQRGCNERGPPTEAPCGLCGPLTHMSRPEARPIWVLVRNQTPERAGGDMPEPSVASVKTAGRIYLFGHALFDLPSHPRHETISLAQRTKIADPLPFPIHCSAPVITQVPLGTSGPVAGATIGRCQPTATAAAPGDHARDTG